MKKEQLEKVPFRMAGHVSMAHEHTATYVNQQYGFVMVCCTKVTKNGMDFGKTRRVFIYEHKKYYKPKSESVYEKALAQRKELIDKIKGYKK